MPHIRVTNKAELQKALANSDTAISENKRPSDKFPLAKADQIHARLNLCFEHLNLVFKELDFPHEVIPAKWSNGIKPTEANIGHLENKFLEILHKKLKTIASFLRLPEPKLLHSSQVRLTTLDQAHLLVDSFLNELGTRIPSDLDIIKNKIEVNEERLIYYRLADNMINDSHCHQNLVNKLMKLDHALYVVRTL